LNNKFFHSLLRIGISGAASQLITFLALPLLSRLYSPNSFGIWALIQSAALILGGLATCRYELAVVLPKENEKAFHILMLGLCLAIGMTILSVLFISLGGSDLMSISNTTIVWAVPPLIFFAALTQLGLAWCTRTGAFTLYSSVQFGSALLAGVLPALMAVYIPDEFGLVMGSLFSSAIISLLLWCYILRDCSRLDLLRKINLHKIVLVGIEYKAYPIYMTPYSMIGTIRDRALYFFMGLFSNISEIGLYSIAQRLSNVPNSLVSSALRPVFYQHIVKAEKLETQKLIENVMSWLAVLFIPPIIFFLYNPSYFIQLVFGSQWASASHYVVILLICSLPLIFGNWMDRYIDVLGRQKMAFVMELLFSCLAITTAGIAFWNDASPEVAVACQAGVMSIYYAVWIFVVFKVAELPIIMLKNILWLVLKIITLFVAAISLGEVLMGFLVAMIFWALAWLIIILWKFSIYKKACSRKV
jgi:O-antigen/teichoic acid export membrane protein